MKQIVSTTKQITLDVIGNKSIVGVQFKSGVKVMIIETQSEEFTGLANDSLSLNGNWNAASKKEYIENAFNQNGSKAYLFDTKEELINWFATKE